MMKSKIIYILFALFINSTAFAEVVEFPKPPIPLGLGVDYKNTCSNINDSKACDMANFISNAYGSLERRYGSEFYIENPISSQPINSLYRAYVSSVGIQYKSLIATTWDRIYHSTGETNPVWTLVTNAIIGDNQHWSFDMMNGQVILTGDRLTDPIYKFNIVTSSLSPLQEINGTTAAAVIRAKYIKQSRNYLFAANVAEISTQTNALTYYPNRVYYSLLLQPSSFTAARYIELRTDGFEDITAMWEQGGRIEVSFPSSIYEIDFNVANLTAFGGDIQVTQIVNGFGFIAPRTIAVTGLYSIGLSKEGIIRWDGSRKTRLTAVEEKDILSTDIEPVINRVIRAKTYTNAVAKYYPKRQWYVLGIEDPEKFPRGRINSVYVYDLVIGQWFPMKNWNPECFEVLDAPGDNGDLLFGSSNDGLVAYADKFGVANDIKQQLIVDNMDSLVNPLGQWLRGVIDYVNVIEGSGSIRIQTGPSSPVLANSSITRMGVFDFGEWPDKSKITKDDLIQFKVFTASHVQNISSVRIDLSIHDISGDFDTEFTSVTISSAMLTNGGTAWNTIQIPFSSFTILSEWTDLSTEVHPYSDALLFYGIRLDLVTVGSATIYVDDLRIVGAKERALNAFRLSKQYNFGTNAEKTFVQIFLDAEIADDTNFYVDVFKDFGKTARTITVSGGYEKELYVAGYGGSENVTVLDSIDFSVKRGTLVASPNVFGIRSMFNGKNSLFALDRSYHRILKIDKSTITSPSVIISSFGSIGNGSGNLNNPWQISGDNNYVYVTDMGNNRIAVCDQETLSEVFYFGELGKGTTNLHVPSGIFVSEANVFVGDDGNKRIVKYLKDIGRSTFSYQTHVDLNMNTFGSLMLSGDEEYLYALYNVVSATSVNFLDIILEKRLQSDLSLVNKVVIRPENGVAISSRNVMGEPAVGGDFIYVPFTDDYNGGGRYYIQKLLLRDFSLVREYSSLLAHYGVSAIGTSFNPRRRLIVRDTGIGDATYIQLRIYDKDLDNTLKLFGNTFAIIQKPFKER